MTRPRNQKTRKQPRPPATAPALVAFQTIEVERAKLKTAAYNPRDIAEEAKTRLWASLDKNGLVEPFVWNRRTGNLVGGHQRLAWLDARQGIPAGDKYKDTGLYKLTVAAIDVPLESEKAINVALNNPKIQGHFDDRKLAALLQEIDDLEASGFNLEELSALVDEASVILKALDVKAPPKMAWALIGIALGRFGEISAAIEALAKIPETLVETTVSDDGNENRQCEPAGKA